MNIVKELQEQTAKLLNDSAYLKALGVRFLAEDSLDIDFQLREAVLRQGLAAAVMTPRLSYVGRYEGRENVWQGRIELDLVENPTVWRAWLKKKGLPEGTALDVAAFSQAWLGGSEGPVPGEYCPVSVEQGEDNGLVVVKAMLDCYASTRWKDETREVWLVRYFKGEGQDYLKTLEAVRAKELRWLPDLFAYGWADGEGQVVSLQFMEDGQGCSAAFFCSLELDGKWTSFSATQRLDKRPDASFSGFDVGADMVKGPWSGVPVF